MAGPTTHVFVALLLHIQPCAQVRVLFDGSCLEVFAGLSDEDVARGCLSTRIYHGRSAQPGLAFFAVDGDAIVSNVRSSPLVQ